MSDYIQQKHQKAVMLSLSIEEKHLVTEVLKLLWTPHPIELKQSVTIDTYKEKSQNILL